MAKYDVEYACGHIEEVELFGTYKEREWKLSRMAEEDCPACRAQKAAEMAQALGLPELQGTEKQIAWAADVRQKAVPHIKKLRDEIEAKGGQHPDLQAKALQMLDEWIAEKRSTWWIDHRHELGSYEAVRGMASLELKRSWQDEKEKRSTARDATRLRLSATSAGV